MTAAPMPVSGIVDSPPRAAGIVRQRVLAVLLVALLLALWLLPFLRVAPNRLLSGQGVNLLVVLHGGWYLLGLGLVWLAAAVVLPPRRGIDFVTVLVAALLLAGLTALAGAEATRQSALLSPLARVSLNGGFWLGALLLWAIGADALRRLWPGRALAVVLLLPPVLLLAGGALDDLSLLKEYANRDEVFAAAVLRHLQIVGVSLLPALLVGLPLDVAAARRPGLARPLFVVLNLVQTIPSIALFGLLIGPLAWLGQAWPASGVQGIGLLPAAIALTLYALLPIVHGVTSGLQQIAPPVLEAASAMGMSRRQRFWQIECPLAWPVLLSALRLTTVQLVGLVVVAALIGAGGLGAIVFQGLLGSALDLVLLGVIPVLAIALVVDAGFAVLLRASVPSR
ncbi:ABC transporter permease [Piscinibacter sakaiensis]|uniref:ABC transporter permease n=1 Tax=Piscinibacter sakaiensis TaxID=1547922 RepID=UPI003AACA14E